MINIKVLSKYSIKLLFRQLNDSYPGLIDITDKIYYFVNLLGIQESINNYKIFKKKFKIWENNTIFHPKPFSKPEINHCFNTPIHEYICYHEKFYSRRKDSLGVISAIETLYKSQIIYVILTFNRKAFLYNSDLKLFKILNRQDCLFKTWLNHLDGLNIANNQNATIGIRSPERLYFDLVVLLYGNNTSPPLKNNRRCITNSHNIYKLIKEVSYQLPIDPKNRLNWYKLDSSYLKYSDKV